MRKLFNRINWVHSNQSILSFYLLSLPLLISLNPPNLRAMKEDATPECTLDCECLYRQATARFTGSANNHDCSAETPRGNNVSSVHP